MTDYAGIDYGHGRTNIDTATRIRFGVISIHSLGQVFFDSQEFDYGDPTCPKCGKEAVESSEIEVSIEDFEGTGEYACDSCDYLFDSDEAFGEEPVGWHFKDDKYALMDCLDTDAMILKSPYYTHAQFCSPCVPGAGNLDTPVASGPKTYCLGREWFEEGVTPYDVYSVETDELVYRAGEKEAEAE